MKKQDIDFILTQMLDAENNVSDLNFTVGKPPQVESAGELIPVQLTPDIKELTPFQMEKLALGILNGNRRLTESLMTEGSCDLSYKLGDRARFRVNIFSQSGHYSIVLRKLESRIPTLNELKLPKAFMKIAEEKNGIVFITGSTGSGKSTSLAAVLDDINSKRAVHVVTLEDPVEFQHKHKKATFNQRELGTDFNSFANGLRAALRQAPKIILVGEMRDRETVEIGLSAAETGHLVLTTLHTTDAGQTINRIVGMFAHEEEKQIRIRLADSLRWVVCQRLLPKTDGGRVAAFEIMSNNLRVKESILTGESEGKTFYEIIKDGSAAGMVTFDDYILALYQAGKIDEKTAAAHASQRGVVLRGVDMIKSARGEETTHIKDLEIDVNYEKSISEGFDFI